ncbi:MAG: beta-lactamase family protein, partial [Acidimicrobiia bacterium]|nr:beta-lactamase family protein [Acidimicrobiia bacterium]
MKLATGASLWLIVIGAVERLTSAGSRARIAVETTRRPKTTTDEGHDRIRLVNSASLDAWVDKTATTALLVQIAGETVVEIDRPIPRPGWIGLDGAAHFGASGGEIGLPFEPLPDGRMRHDVASVQKSIVAVLVAIGDERGVLQLDDPVTAHLGPGWSRATADQEAAVTIRHLLAMTSGLGDDLSYVAPAGTRWWYDLGPTWHQLKPLLEAATGETLSDLTDRWLTGPLGMDETTWIDRPGMTYHDGRPFEALSTSARDLARFGQMVLENGTTEAVGIIERKSLAPLFEPSQDLNRAYGLLWWLNGQRPRRVPMVDKPVDDFLMP